MYIIAGPEFGERQGHTLIIVKALYGFRSSGLRWHERFADCLHEMGFTPCKAEPDIWMRRVGNLYEYIGTYVDNLVIVSKNPEDIARALTQDYKFKLKGTGPIAFHLGCDYYRDKNGILCFAPRKYIEKMVSTYETMFGTKPKQNVYTPIEEGDHPELDTRSPELNLEDMQKYQSLIGAMQWAMLLGRIDITMAVMTLSSFRAAPQQGHMDRAK